MKHMAAGVSFIRDIENEHPEEAYPEFKKAYELSCSLNALRNLALSAMKLELDGEAIEYYAIVLEKKTDLAEKDRAQIQDDLAKLKTSVAWVTLSSDRPGVSLVDVRTPRKGVPIRNTYDIGLAAKKIGLHPGNHKLTASVEGFPDKSWNVQIENGSAHSHEFVFDPNAPVTAEGFTEQDEQEMTGDKPEESDGGGGVPIYVWIAGGVTVAAAIPMAIFMGMSMSKKAEYDDEILGKKPINEQQDAHDSLKTTNLLADIFLGVTAAGAAATLILFLTAPSDDDAAASKGTPRIGVDYTIAPMIDPQGGAGALVTARF